MIQVKPIPGDDPGWCHMVRGTVPCTNEAVVVADVPIPGLDGVTVPVKWCRQDWAEAYDTEEIHLRKLRKLERVQAHDDDGTMTLGSPPMPDNN